MKIMEMGQRPCALDKIRAYYLDGKRLSDKQEEKRLQYEQANSLRVKGYSVEQTVRLLISKGVVGSTAEAYRVVRSSEELFGDVGKSNRDGLKYVLTENFMRIYRKAWQSGNLKECNRALENIASINGLHNPDELQIDWNKIFIPVPIFTSEPEVLKRQETEDTIDFTVEDDE